MKPEDDVVLDDVVAPELDDRDHALIAAVRGLEPSGRAPDWAALEASIQAATTRAPRRGRYLVGAALGALAVAAAVALWLARPAATRPFPTLVIAPPAPVPAEVDVEDDAAEDELAADDSDLGAMGAIDDDLVDEVLELEEVADEARETEDLPAVGAAWTAWIDDFSDDDLDEALRWLDTQEAT